MTRTGSFLRGETGASAAEFALVLPIFLLFLLGIIDVGRYAWAINEVQKATQVGARWAVATDMIPSGLASYSFAVSGGIPQGDPIGEAAFPGVECTSAGGTCTCLGASCGFPLDKDQAAFDAVVARMRTVYPQIPAEDVVIQYRYSGLGYSGTPDPDPDNGVYAPDVSPIVTVRIDDLRFPLVFLLGKSVPLPDFSYSLTMEDSSGDTANY